MTHLTLGLAFDCTPLVGYQQCTFVHDRLGVICWAYFQVTGAVHDHVQAADPLLANIRPPKLNDHTGIRMRDS
jgi:phage tail protein X